MNFLTRLARIERLHTRLLAASATLVLTAGCVHVESVAPSSKALILDIQQEAHYFGGVATLPKGRYEPQFQTTGGTYYRAPSSLILRGLGASAPVSGGLFIPSTLEHKQGFWMEEKGAQTFAFELPVTYHYAP